MWGLTGNDAAVALLQQGMAQQRLAHAYLLVGPQGVGKTTLALALARALNCLAAAPPCGACGQCRRIAASLHPDIAVLQPEAGKRELGIQAVRELQAAIALRPFEGRQRIAIIPDADRLTLQAANALLKTLEEPPDQVTLVLTTTDDEPLLPTIRSRCRRVDLRPVDHATLAAALLTRGADEPTASFLARFARGRPGLAFTALSDPGVETALQTAFVQLRALLAAPTPQRLEGLDALASGQGAQREVTMAVLETWLEWLRDALLVKAGCPGGVVHAGELPAYTLVAEAVELRSIRGALRDVVEAARQIDLNANPRLVLDVLALRLPGVPSLGEPAVDPEPADPVPAAAPAGTAGANSGRATS